MNQRASQGRKESRTSESPLTAETAPSSGHHATMSADADLLQIRASLMFE